LLNILVALIWVFVAVLFLVGCSPRWQWWRD
jgi:hypothetical protein